MKFILVVASLALATPALAGSAAASKAPSAAKMQKIHKLLRTTHADAPLKATLEGLKARMPPEQYDAFSKRVKADDILEFIAAAYDRHFSEADIDGLLAFYETPLGKRLIDEGPAVQRESAEAAQQYLMEKLRPADSEAPPMAAPAQDVPAK